MAFRHGVYKSEVPTSVIAPAQSTAGLPVIIGTAPIQEGNPGNINKPVLVYSYEEAVREFGYSDDWIKYTLCEFMYSQFALFNQAPAVLINVYDPAVHESPSDVKASDIIGGIDSSTEQHKGLELINDIFPKFRLVPGLIGAPRWSEQPGVAAVMRAKAENINGLFSCMAVADIPTGKNEADIYSKAPEWKNQHNYVSERLISCWPRISLDGKVFHMSTQLIGLLNKTDSEHDDVPCKSPSNELLQMDSTCKPTGAEIMLGHEQASYLNSQGIVTALNWIGGWRAWGNRTAAYPANTDPKDCFIPVRRMFDFIANQFILTFWQKVDQPMTVRLVRTIVNSFNLYLNSLVAREMLLGARVEFRETENAITDLMNGILRFHVYITPPLPAEVIEGVFEYDPEYLSLLYNALT